MIRFEPSTEDDFIQILAWQTLDDSKATDLDPSFWVTGSDTNPLTCKVVDEHGTVLFLRMDKEGTGLRMHTLFIAPETKETRKRIATLLGNHFLGFAKQMAVHGGSITFESTSPSLVNFMLRSK